MAQKDLDPVQAQLVLLALQKQQVAKQNAEAQFSADVAIISKALELPEHTAINFHIENGVGTATWADA